MILDFENKYKNIYFIGIGGISMSGLAEILNFKGLQVKGSDMKASAVTAHLENLGIEIHYGHKAENITQDIDLVVFTAAVKEDNPEIVAAKAKGILVIERSDLLGSIMSCYSQSIAIAGTHGKTTTTSMLSEILLAAKTDPTISVGGILSTIGGNTKIGNSQFFLAEACEYHDSFLKFNPFVAVILNVEAEHLDYFKDLHQIQTSFRGFASNVPKEGYVIINNCTAGKEYITQNLKSTVITYGLDNTANWYADAVVHEPDGRNSFDAVFNGKVMGRIALRIPGEHNILNALAACAAATALNIPISSVIAGLDNYTGVNRRFQYKGSYNGIRVIDDYAHHPTEIRATLAAAQKVEHKTLWCVFQPHTYSRAKTLFEDFGKAFADADEIIVTDIYAAREKDTGIIHARDIVEKIRSHGKSARYISSFDDIVAFIKSTAQPGDMLITMGAGDVYSVGESLVRG